MPRVVIIKTIKPQRFNEAALRNRIRYRMYKVRDGILKDFKATTENWEHEVKWKSVTHFTKRLPSPSVEVWTDDEIYRYVNDGTKPHDIWAGWYTGKSEHKVLAFPSQSSPKTTPGSLKSGPGSSGGAIIFTPYVQHPGGKARNFTGQIEKKWTPRFKRAMERAMSDARKASGHAI